MQLGQEEEALARQTEVGLYNFAKRRTINQQKMVIFYGVILYGVVIMTSNGIQLTTNQMIFGSQNDGLSQSTLSSPAAKT